MKLLISNIVYERRVKSSKIWLLFWLKSNIRVFENSRILEKPFNNIKNFRCQDVKSKNISKSNVDWKVCYSNIYKHQFYEGKIK